MPDVTTLDKFITTVLEPYKRERINTLKSSNTGGNFSAIKIDNIPNDLTIVILDLFIENIRKFNAYCDKEIAAAPQNGAFYNAHRNELLENLKKVENDFQNNQLNDNAFKPGVINAQYYKTSADHKSEIFYYGLKGCEMMGTAFFMIGAGAAGIFLLASLILVGPAAFAGGAALTPVLIALCCVAGGLCAIPGGILGGIGGMIYGHYNFPKEDFPKYSRGKQFHSNTTFPYKTMSDCYHQLENDKTEPQLKTSSRYSLFAQRDFDNSADKATLAIHP